MAKLRRKDELVKQKSKSSTATRLLGKPMNMSKNTKKTKTDIAKIASVISSSITKNENTNGKTIKIKKKRLQVAKTSRNDDKPEKPKNLVRIIVPEEKESLKKQETVKKSFKRSSSNPLIDFSYSSPKDVKSKVIRKAVDALIQVNEKQSNKNALFNEETVVFLQIVCVKVPECPDRVVRFTLPHLLTTSTSEICLIVSDKKKGKRFDHEPTIEMWKDLLEEKGVSEVKTVLPMRQLKTEFDQFELKRRLKTMHDVFLVDAKICGHVSHILGKVFKAKNIVPTPVRIGKDEQHALKETIKKALHKTPMRIHNAVSTTTVRIGHVGMKAKQLSENIQAAIDQLDTLYPGGTENVRSIHIKTPLSIAVPVYITLKPGSLVKRVQIKQKRPKLYETVEDELSTMPGSWVRVSPEGTVEVIKKEDEDNASDSDDDEGADSDEEKSGKVQRRKNYITPLSDASLIPIDSDESEDAKESDDE